MILILLSSGLFLGWSLGANDAANVFGTAVGTRMIKFYTAAIIASIFILLGAVFAGAGASHTLGKLGAINSLSGAFTVALSAGLTVATMTKFRLPVSTSQAIVGAIIGWNIFAGAPTDSGSLIKILMTWVLCPVLSAVFSIILYKITKVILANSSIHILKLDQLTRVFLIIVGAFGAYSLGANNISNVMGVFVEASPFNDYDLFGIYTFSSIQQLFLVGAISIGVGVFTYSRKVMSTVGGDLFKLSPITAVIVVLAESLVLFIFASEGLHHWFVSHNLPAIPLVPVSSSQAVVGAILGIAIAKGGRNFKWSVMGRISSGWVSTPLISALTSLILLFFAQNVFDQQVYKPIEFSFNKDAIEKLSEKLLQNDILTDIHNKKFLNHKELKVFLASYELDQDTKSMIFEIGENSNIYISDLINEDNDVLITLSDNQRNSLLELRGRKFLYEWQLFQELEQLSIDWNLKGKDKLAKKHIHKQFQKVLLELKRFKEPKQ